LILAPEALLVLVVRIWNDELDLIGSGLVLSFHNDTVLSDLGEDLIPGLDLRLDILNELLLRFE
jgi:hypothetical protein